MSDNDTADLIAESVRVLRQHGARFGYLHGSRVTGTVRPDSDLDVAAFFGGTAPNAFEVLLPTGVDLLVLDTAPLELAGRVAAHGRLLFEQDQAERVYWEATTRKIYFDELPRMTRSHREFAESVRRGRVAVSDSIVLARLDDPTDLATFAAQVAAFVADRE